MSATHNSLRLFEPEPWSDEVNGAALLDEIVDTVRMLAVMPSPCLDAVALWSAYTHCFDAFQHAPRLVITSPEKRCGKTTLLHIIQKLVPRPLPCSNITGPALFRTEQRAEPTLLIDEADTFLRRCTKDWSSPGA